MNMKDVKQLSYLYGVEPESIKSIINTELEHQRAKLRAIMAVAIDYFKTQEGARTWFATVNRGLGGVTPLSLLNTEKGFQRV
jgi:uncharacterized protein (DUF2384 family)